MLINQVRKMLLASKNIDSLRNVDVSALLATGWGTKCSRFAIMDPLPEANGILAVSLLTTPSEDSLEMYFSHP